MTIVGLLGIIHDDREVSKSNKEAKKHNTEEKARVKNNADLAAQMEREYKQTLSYLSSEYNKADSLLTREFDTLKFKKVPQSLETGLFFCQFFRFYTCSFVLFMV